MAGSYPPQGPEAKGPAGRVRSGRLDDAELLAPPEVDPVQLSRSMFTQPAPRPAPAPLTNLHLKKVARMDAAAISGDGGGGGGGGGSGGRSGTAAARIRSARSARSARSVAASSVRGGRAAFSVVSDEEVIDVDGEPTTLADDDLDLPPSPVPEGDDDDDEGNATAAGCRTRGPNRAGNLGMSGIAGLTADECGGPDPLEELEADTPAVRLAEVTADLEAAMQTRKDPWVVVHMAQLALGHAKVVWRTMPVTVREEPLLLAKAHFSLARAYQGLGCDRQASDHGKQALAAIPKEVTDTEAARALRTEVQVMRAEALLSSATVPGIGPEPACIQARKALALLVKAAGLQEPVAWTSEEVEDNELSGIKKATIDSVTDAGIVALMAQCHSVLAEAKLREAEAEDGERKSSLRSADAAAARLDRRTDCGDPFYSAEQLERYRAQVQSFRDEAETHLAEVVRLAGESERSYDAAMYCLNHVLDVEGSRIENSLGREGKLAHPTFQALWRRSLDLFAGIGTAYALQRKDSLRLGIVNEILSAFAQYGTLGWLPPGRHIQALKDKGALLVDKRDYEGATACYEELAQVVTELFGNDPVRRELQVAEVLKLRGDVALAGGDFRTAQHMFNQALDYYQRHLGAGAQVAQDLLHRIDEVKAYLADTRVLGRLASLPSRQGQGGAGGSGSAASTSSSAAGGAGGGGGGTPVAARSPAPSVLSTRSNVSRPPPLSNPGSVRSSAVHSIPTAPPTAASVRSSADGGDVTSSAGPAAMSTASTPQSHRVSTSSAAVPAAASGGIPGTGTSTPMGGSQRTSSALGMSTRLSGHGAGVSVHGSVDGLSAGGGVGNSWNAPAAPSAAGSLRRESGSDLAGHNWAAAAAAASPAPSTRSYRSGVAAGGRDDGGYGGASSPAAQSHRSGYGGGLDGGAASPAAQSQRSGYNNFEGLYGGAAAPVAPSQRSGGALDGGSGGAASPAALSHRSGFGAESSYPRAPPSVQSQRSGAYDAGAASPAALSYRSGYGGGAGVYGNGAAPPAPQFHRSGGFDGGAASPAPQSQRSGYGGGGGGFDGGYGGGAPSVSQSLRSADFSHLRGHGSTAGSQPRASGIIDEDEDDAAGIAEDVDDGMYGSHVSSASPSITAAARRLAASSSDLSGGGVAAMGPPSARSQRSGAAATAAVPYGGRASPSAGSHRSGVAFDGPYGGAASPAAQSHSSGYGGGYGGYGGGYGSNYGGAASPAAMSQRSGEFGQLGKVNSSSSFRRSNNDPMEF